MHDIFYMLICLIVPIWFGIFVIIFKAAMSKIDRKHND